MTIMSTFSESINW